jgi:hypothetical protein
LSAERWRKPVIPIDIEPVDQGIVLPDGRSLAVAAPILRPEDIERAREGFICLKCLEPFERPWPERCHVCGAPIRREQAAYLAREFAEEKLGPRTSIEDELAALREKETTNGTDDR